MGEDQANDRQFEATGAASKIFKWKAHVLGEQNHGQVKSQILISVEEYEAF